MKLDLTTPNLHLALDKVYLNGVEQTLCVSLDTKRKILVRFKKDSAGKLIPYEDSYETEEVSGMIGVKLHPGWRYSEQRGEFYET